MREGLLSRRRRKPSPGRESSSERPRSSICWADVDCPVFALGVFICGSASLSSLLKSLNEQISIFTVFWELPPDPGVVFPSAWNKTSALKGRVHLTCCTSPASLMVALHLSGIPPCTWEGSAQTDPQGTRADGNEVPPGISRALVKLCCSRWLRWRLQKRGCLSF